MGIFRLQKTEKYHLDAKDQEKNSKSLYAEYSLHFGNTLNAIKKYRDKVEPRKWGQWRVQHLGFISTRTCENVMNIAREAGVEEFTHLGISALNLIRTGIDDLYPESKYTRRFHAFFEESGYPYQDYHKTRVVKKLIATHVFEVKANREGIIFDITHIKALAEYNDILNDKLIEDLLQHQQTGSANERLKTLIMGRGKQQKLSTTIPPKSKQLSLDRTLNNFKETLEYYINNFHKLGEVRMEDIEQIQIQMKEQISKIYWDKLIYDSMQ